MLGDEDSGRAHGAALGAGGIESWWAWKYRPRIRDGIDAVSPGTLRGTVHVLVWLFGLAAITVLGPLLIDLPRAVWFGIALVVMVVVGRSWDARTGPSATSSEVR